MKLSILIKKLEIVDKYILCREQFSTILPLLNITRNSRDFRGLWSWGIWRRYFRWERNFQENLFIYFFIAYSYTLKGKENLVNEIEVSISNVSNNQKQITCSSLNRSLLDKPLLQYCRNKAFISYYYFILIVNDNSNKIKRIVDKSVISIITKDLQN